MASPPPPPSSDSEQIGIILLQQYKQRTENYAFHTTLYTLSALTATTPTTSTEELSSSSTSPPQPPPSPSSPQNQQQNQQVSEAGVTRRPSTAFLSSFHAASGLVLTSSSSSPLSRSPLDRKSAGISPRSSQQVFSGQQRSSANAKHLSAASAKKKTNRRLSMPRSLREVGEYGLVRDDVMWPENYEFAEVFDRKFQGFVLYILHIEQMF